MTAAPEKGDHEPPPPRVARLATSPFAALLHKNLLLKARAPASLALEVLLPVAFTLVLVLIRATTVAEPFAAVLPPGAASDACGFADATSGRRGSRFSSPFEQDLGVYCPVAVPSHGALLAAPRVFGLSTFDARCADVIDGKYERNGGAELFALADDPTK